MSNYQVNVINTTDPFTAFSSIVHQDDGTSDFNYFKNKVSRMSSMALNASTEFLQRGKQIFESVYSGATMNAARHAIDSVKGVMSTVIHRCMDLDQLKLANLISQRYFMANPVVREVYNKQLCDGYSQTYHDLEPGKIGSDHYDYRRVIQGMTQFNEDDGEAYSEHFDEVLLDGDKELEFNEQIAILDSWELMSSFMLSGYLDCTNPLPDAEL